MRFHSSTVLAGSHEVLRGLRGGPGWFEVRLYEGFRVPQDSARAVGPEVSQGSTKLCNNSTRVPQGSTMLHQAKPKSMVFSTLSLFCDLLTCSGKCWLCGKSDHVAAELTVQQSKVNAWHCCLVGFGFQEFHEAARAMKSEGFHQILQKLWGSPEERFQQSFTLSSTKVAVCEVYRLHCQGPPDCTVWARSAPIAPSRPDRGPTQSGPVNCTKLASPSFAIDTVAIRILRKIGVEL